MEKSQSNRNVNMHVVHREHANKTACNTRHEPNCSSNICIEFLYVYTQTKHEQRKEQAANHESDIEKRCKFGNSPLPEFGNEMIEG